MTEHTVAGHPDSGDDLLRMLSALSNPHRLRIMAKLFAGRDYVSQLARDIQISRPLLHMHLQRLEAAGLIAGEFELSEDGKAMKYYSVTPFVLALTPELIARLAETLSSDSTEMKGTTN